MPKMYKTTGQQKEANYSKKMKTESAPDYNSNQKKKDKTVAKGPKKAVKMKGKSYAIKVNANY